MFERGQSLRGKKAKLCSEVEGYRLSAFRSPYLDEGDGVKWRDVNINIELGEALVGVAELREWALPEFADRDDFFDAADGVSSEDSDMAELLGAFWKWEDWPGLYGNLILFNRLAIDSRRDLGGKALGSLNTFLSEAVNRRAKLTPDRRPILTPS
jgi:hypothetical protein